MEKQSECANCGCSYFGHGHNGDPLVKGFVCDACQVKVLEMRFKEAKLYECIYCYKKKMKSVGQICSTCHKLFGKYVITLGEIK